MSLVTKVDLLATRVAQEFNTVRGEIGALNLLTNVDGGSPSSVYSASQAALDGGSP